MLDLCGCTWLSLVGVSWAVLCCRAWACSLQWLSLLQSVGSWCERPVFVTPGKWDLPRAGTEPVCPALVDGFLTTAPQGRRQWHPTPVLLPGKSHGWRSLVGCSPWGREESDTTERLHFSTFHFHALEKEMAIHSSVLAWRIPGTGEPGGLPSLGSHRVRHD